MLKKEFIDGMLENLSYEVKKLWIEKKGNSVLLRNFGKYGASGLWSIVIEEIKNMEEK